MQDGCHRNRIQPSGRRTHFINFKTFGTFLLSNRNKFNFYKPVKRISMVIKQKQLNQTIRGQKIPCNVSKEMFMVLIQKRFRNKKPNGRKPPLTNLFQWQIIKMVLKISLKTARRKNRRQIPLLNCRKRKTILPRFSLSKILRKNHKTNSGGFSDFHFCLEI